MHAAHEDIDHCKHGSQDESGDDVEDVDVLDLDIGADGREIDAPNDAGNDTVGGATVSASFALAVDSGRLEGENAEAVEVGDETLRLIIAAQGDNDAGAAWHVLVALGEGGED